jgi:hypothetical protein
MNGSSSMTPEHYTKWEAEVRSLYDGMVRIVVTPTWAKLIDFETTLPSAVEELAGSGTSVSAAEPTKVARDAPPAAIRASTSSSRTSLTTGNELPRSTSARCRAPDAGRRAVR